jgi:hypothetical protein
MSVTCHHSYSDDVHIRKEKQLLFNVTYRVCHQTWIRHQLREGNIMCKVKRWDKCNQWAKETENVSFSPSCSFMGEDSNAFEPTKMCAVLK